MVRIAVMIAAAALGLLASSAARSDGRLERLLTTADRERLSGFEATRARAVAEAWAGGAAPDVAVLDRVLSGTPLSVRDIAGLTGDWRCRTLKLGRGVPLVVYGWFRCRIVEDGAGLRLEKLDGSQRTRGIFHDRDETTLVYLGALHYAAEPPQAYGKVPDRDQVALVYRPAPNRLRMEFPAPTYDSLFDILDLERR